MNGKKVLTAVIAILVIVVIGFGIYKMATGNLFSEDGTIANGKADMIKHIKSITDSEERSRQIDFALGSSIITQEEANELRQY